MIFRRYGTSLQSVDIHFESLALNEIGFRRNRERSIPVDDLESGYELVGSHEVVAEAEGDVQDHTERDLLEKLEARIRQIEAGAGKDEIVVMENAPGSDWPKTKHRTRNVIVEGENRLHFTYTIGPSIRIGVYRERS